jgi:hypothetical protein
MTGEPEDTLAAFRATVDDAVKMKAKMLARSVVAAKVKCSRCDGMLHGRISGPRRHFRMWCDGTCKRMFME